MKKIIALAASFALLLSGSATAAIVNSLPYNLTNGSLADATQVMGNFNQIVNNTNTNAAHNGANSDITSLTGLTTPLAPSFGGTAYYIGGTSTGSANAQVVATLSPIGFSLGAGNVASMIAGFTNTSALTVNFNGTGATSVINSAGSALTGGEVQSGKTYVFAVAAGGTSLEILNPSIGMDATNFAISSLGKLAFGSAPVLPSATTATTQTSSDSSTKLATTAFVHTAVPVYHFQAFNSTGSNTFTTPATTLSTTSFKFTILGAGGAGGGAAATGGGAGGGAGSTAIYVVSGLSASTGYTITVGTGGAGASNAMGNSGGSTTVVVGATTVTAPGGGGGQADVAGAGANQGGSGGAACTNATDCDQGGGGQSAGNNQGGDAAGGGGGASSRGGGAQGLGSTSQDGVAGNACGSGGSGGWTNGANVAGGAGANGCARVEWVL